MNEIKQKILEFANYKDNWNGNEAKAFSKEVIKNALNLEKYLYIDKSIIPEIFPTACDSLQIEYEKDDKYLEIEIKKDKYEIYRNINGVESEFYLGLDKVYEIINIIKLFYRPIIDRAILFTGAFNPPTIAHFHMIESANKASDFDYIIFAISNQKFLDKKQKKTGDYAYSEKERLEMILAMTYKEPNVLVFGVEEGYTYQVLCAVKEKYKCESLYFALGSDKLNEIGRWGYHDKLLTEICFYVLQREDNLAYIKEKCNKLFSKTKYVIGQDNKEYAGISATLVREKIKNNKNYKELVCNEVYNILSNIKENF